MYSPHRRLAFSKDRLFVYFPTILFQKKSILREVFNEELHKLTQAGLIQHWTSKYMDKRNLKTHRTPSTIQIKHIISAIKICITLYILSVVVFIFEILTAKCQRIKYFLDFLNY